MAIFKCAKCGCAENTVFGLWWTRKYPEMYDWGETGKEYRGKGLCSECAPKSFINGEPTGWGKWHGRFPKKPYETDNQ